jgi:hypothetical protein
LLADHELFWIAEEYLHLPAELQPPSSVDDPALPDWYTALREDWQVREAAPVSLEQFTIRQASLETTKVQLIDGLEKT